MRTEQLLALDETMERMAGDRGLLVSLFRLFIDDAPKKLRNIDQHAEEGDLFQVERNAHSMKGAAATVGAKRLCLLAADLEQAAKKGEREEMERLRQDLADVCDQTLSAMRGICDEP